MSTSPDDSDAEFIRDFIVETLDNLDELDRNFVELEQHPESLELLDAIFRTIHNIKGTSSFFDFPRLEAITHVGESLLDRLRDGRLRLRPDIVDALLVMVDVVRQLLDSIQDTGIEGAVDTTEAERGLRAALREAAQKPLSADDLAQLRADGEAMEMAIELATTGIAVTVPDLRSDDAEPGRRSLSDNSVRVDVALLDQLVRLVGELVLTRNQIVQHAGDSLTPELPRAAARLNLIASELQEGVMKTRMQPIDHVWAKLPRVVRDLGAQCGKKVRLVTEGADTELDRTLLEAVKDPLTHVVRNAVDHGMETPENRVAIGKPEEGTLFLRAFHEGGQVVVEAVDDGAGIDPARVGAKAVERGIITTDQLARMRTTEIVELVFRPGFSTAAAVTSVSGRGVGMDVVRTNIENIGGTVELTSELGRGTTVRIKIPLTLAVIPALVIGQHGDRYAIPQVNLLEVVHLEGDAVERGVESLAGAPVYRLRGRLLPLVFLDEQLQLETPQVRESLDIVVLSAEQTQFGLVVASVHDTQEIVVKPLSKQLKGLKAFAGATIMGDGKVSLILDVPGLAARAHARLDGTHLNGRNDRSSEAARREVDPVLVCELSGSRRFALPLADVARVEEFLPSAVERAGNIEVVQYRQELLRLLRLDCLLGIGADTIEEPAVDEGPAPMTVVVYNKDGRDVGLVVKRIVDVVDHEFTVNPVSARDGLLGTAVIDKCVTDLLDVPALVVLAEAGAHV